MHDTSFRWRDRSAASAPAWGVLLVIGILSTLILALPALLVGILAARLLRDRSWRMLLWLMLSMLSMVLLVLFWTHGLRSLVLAQLTMLFHNARRYQAHLTQWDWGALWSQTWPLWVQSLVAVPLVALWCNLAATHAEGAEAMLAQQEKTAERRRLQAHRRAKRRARDPGRLPDAVDASMVIGVALPDEERP